VVIYEQRTKKKFPIYFTGELGVFRPLRNGLKPILFLMTMCYNLSDLESFDDKI